MSYTSRRSIMLLFSAMAISGCTTTSQPPLQLAQRVDMPCVLGRWYIVATIPNWFEKGMIAPVDAFTLREDGDIQEDFETQWHSFASPRRHYVGRISIRPNTGNAHWRVHMGPIDLPFLLIDAEKDCRYLLWGENNRSLGWIYSRTPEMNDATYAMLLQRFASQGYDTSRFRKIVQTPGDIPKHDFWTDGIQTVESR